MKEECVFSVLLENISALRAQQKYLTNELDRLIDQPYSETAAEANSASVLRSQLLEVTRELRFTSEELRKLCSLTKKS